MLVSTAYFIFCFDSILILSADSLFAFTDLVAERSRCEIVNQSAHATSIEPIIELNGDRRNSQELLGGLSVAIFIPPLAKTTSWTSMPDCGTNFLRNDENFERVDL